MKNRITAATAAGLLGALLALLGTPSAGAHAHAIHVVIASGPSGIVEATDPAPIPCLAPPDGAIACFDDLPLFSKVEAQYEGIGLVFAKGPKADSGVKPLVEKQAGSTNQVARITRCTNAGEFCDARAWGAFALLRRYVQLKVGALGSGHPFDVSLVAYAANGGLLGSDTEKITPGGILKSLKVSTFGAAIAFFRIGLPASGPVLPALVIDEVAFNKPTGLEKADFGLVPDSVVTGQDVPFGVDKGKSASIRIDIERVNGSTGPITFDLDSPPTGVTATFSPAAPAGDSTIMKVTAAKDAPSTIGTTTLLVRGTPSPTAGTAPRTAKIAFLVRESYDVALSGIEVTQGIQKELEPCYTAPQCVSNISLRGPVQPGDPVPYDGVSLAAHGKTVVRVFAYVRSPYAAEVNDVPVVLHGSRNGQALPGSPLQAWGLYPPTLRWNPYKWTTFAQRVKPAGAYTFVLPDSWTEGTIKLKAKALPPEVIFGATAAECETQDCAANNTFTVTGVAFTKQPWITLVPLYLKAGNEFGPPPPSEVFEPAINLTPLGDGDVLFPPSTYYDVIDVSDIAFDPDLDGDEKRSALNDELEDWADEHPSPEGRPGAGDVVIGVHSLGVSAARGKLPTSIVSIVDQPFHSTPVANVHWGSPYNAVAHELHHMYIRTHASYGCGGGDDGQKAEPWPPDEQGWMHGIGLDRRAGSGSLNAPFRMVAPRDLGAPPGVPGGDPQPPRYYDFMSYCNGGPNQPWTSWEGWEKSFAALNLYGHLSGRLLAAEADREALLVLARAKGDGVEITRVRPSDALRRLDADGSEFVAAAYDAAGRQLSATLMQAVAEHTHDGDGATALAAHVAIPPGGVSAIARVEVRHDGRVVASRSRSGNAPSVELIAPLAGARLPGRGRVEVRWRAADADGDQLRARIDYSQDDGRTWRTRWVGPSLESVALDARALGASQRARIRVRIEDGFQSTAAVSGGLVAVGSPPAVTITSPGGRERLTPGALVYLSGVAYDDTGGRLPDAALVWYDGGRVVASGEHASAALGPGFHVLRLVARDRLGREGSARVSLVVRTTAPRFLVLDAPRRVSSQARALQLRVATTVAARLNIGGRRFDVGPRAKRLGVPIVPGRGRLELLLGLTADGKVTTMRLVVERR